MANLLLLYLEGPLQSWGLRARWDVRDTGAEPSKSGVQGLLGCALGYPMRDPRLEELNQLEMGVRTERPGSRMTDFHTTMGVMRTAEGKAKGKPDDPSTIVSYRSYLQDASFLVVLGGPEDLLERCREALEHPRWPVFLGRKSCPPTRPVLEAWTDSFSSVEDALQGYRWLGAWPRFKRPPRLLCTVDDAQGEVVRADRVTINPARMYGSRRVRKFFVDTPGE